MKIAIVRKPIVAPAFPRLRSDGAVLEFYGVVRDAEEGTIISAIDYEAFAEMAQHQLEILRAKIIAEEKITDIECIHRVGILAVGEASLFVRVIAGHRQEAFRAMMRFVDELKQVVPIWKHPIKK